MSARHPANLNHSLELFSPRGGETGPHGDGWGLAYYDGRAAQVFKGGDPAARSKNLDFIAHQNFSSRIVIAHIRKANSATPHVPGEAGNVTPLEAGKAAHNSIANAHPFQRELFGRSIVFAHNGILPGVFDLPLKQFHPLGETDSEWAFCYLLDRLADDPDIFAEERFHHLLSVLNEFTEKMSGLGKFNFLFSEGRHLFAHGHTSLYSVSRTCRQESCDAPEKAQRVMLVATQPTTDHETWRKLPAGRITVFRKGLEIADSESLGHIPPGVFHDHFIHSQ
jgi:glutamine amidotransferase